MAYILGFLASLILVSASAILLRWRVPVIFVFLWFFLSDSVRKLIPGQPPEILLVGDALLLITYLSFFAYYLIEKKERLWIPPFLGSLLAFATVAIIQIFNPSLPSFQTAAIGLRSYLWFVPLVFLGYEFFWSKEQFLKFCRVLVYMAIPLFFFAVLQGVLGDTAPSFFRPFETTHQAHAFGIGFRGGPVDKISSIFGTDQRYGAVSLFLFLTGLGLLAASRTPKERSRSWVYAGTLSAFLGIIISGSGSAFVMAVFGFLLFVAIARRIAGKEKAIILWGFLKTKWVIFLFVLLLATLLGVYVFFSNVGLSQIFMFVRVFNHLPDVFIKDMQFVIPNAPILGFGTGISAQGLQEIGQSKEGLAELAHQGGETGVKRLLFELGIVGFVVFYVFWGRIFFHIRRLLRTVTDSQLKFVGVAIALFAFLVLLRFTFVHHQALGDYAVLTPLWFFLGTLFKLKELR